MVVEDVEIDCGGEVSTREFRRRLRFRRDNLCYAGSHGLDISTPSASSKYSNHKHQSRTTDGKVSSR
ncbi:hypothetical protein RchiOBHm_Chr4g0414901 [Rosa chinensis]|uniref:Uncharacterized protein n=1 Tax=Rosa chinensis TaxID=74649 RepID=A0A2P6QWE9_ROSCH|nr:hypothetical protein RchiOBHm_Chr4g0414901 [Rosa chinensis]